MSEYFSTKDLDQIESLGISREEVVRQIGQLTDPPPFAHLDRPCVINDGIIVLPVDEFDRLLALHQSAATKGRLIKFVPASGAATRMFRRLLAIVNEEPMPNRKSLILRAEAGDQTAIDGIRFFDNIDNFAFSLSLLPLMAETGFASPLLDDTVSIRKLLQRLLFSKPIGLGFADLPKGLIPFHITNDVSCTALDEHLAEAAAYVCDSEGVCRLHLTVADHLMPVWQEAVAKAVVRWREETALHLSVRFSIQSTATDTIALTGDNQPFRLAGGSILFRPGGHGALINNLEELDGDIVLVKNIDNVAPEHLRADTVLWKQLLTGYLIDLQTKSFAVQAHLSAGQVSDEIIEAAARFLTDEMGISLSSGFAETPREEKIDYIQNSLDRPLRVCGVVKNEGEPGGGPFWVQTREGISRQIVESSQIDHSDPEQIKHMAGATHFNPVDLVLGLRNRKGRPYHLREYIDFDTSFVSEKSQEGEALKALEHPGLWNGAMAKWNTVFVEVPQATFSPVKSVLDLLRAEHQPEME